VQIWKRKKAGPLSVHWFSTFSSFQFNLYYNKYLQSLPSHIPFTKLRVRVDFEQDSSLENIPSSPPASVEKKGRD